MTQSTRYLLTGATGFVGGRLLEALVERGQPVRCLVRQSSDVSLLEKLNAPYVRGDFSDKNWLMEQTADVERVIHIAGATSARSYEEFHRDNCEATTLLADACLTHDSPPAFLFMSSMAATGAPLPGAAVRHEGDEPRPVSNYGRSKLAAEEELRKRADKLAIQIIRPSIVFGREDKASFTMFDIIQKMRIHPSPGWFPKPVSVVHVDDLTKLTLLAIDSPERISADPARQEEGVWFAVDDSEYFTYAEFGRRIIKAMEIYAISLPVGRLTMTLIGAGSQLIGWMQGKPAFFGFDKIRESFTAWKCSGERARQTLGMTFPHSVDQRLKQTVAWYRRNGWLPEPASGRAGESRANQSENQPHGA